MKNSSFFYKYGILIVLVALVICFSILSPAFLTVNNLMNVARQVSMIGITAVGMMFVMLTGGIDLSVGSCLAFVNVVCAYFMVKLDVNPWLAVLICVALSALCGYANGLAITKLRMPALIATMGFMNILKGLAFIISGGLPIYGFDPSFTILGQGYVSVVPIPVIVMAVIFALGWFILNKTYFGRYFYAVGGNEEAARLSGINVSRVKQLVYTLSGIFASLAGIIMLSRLNSGQPTTGTGFEFQVIIAVVLGGVSINGGSGRIFGVIIGVMIMGVLSNGLILINVNDYVQDVVQGVVLISAVGFDCVSKYRSEIRLKEMEKNRGEATAAAPGNVYGGRS